MTIVVLILLWLAAPEKVSQVITELNQLSLLVLISLNFIPNEEDGDDDDDEGKPKRIYRLPSITEESEPNEENLAELNDLSKSRDNNFLGLFLNTSEEGNCRNGSSEENISTNPIQLSPRRDKGQIKNSPIPTEDSLLLTEKQTSLAPIEPKIITDGPGPMDLFYTFDDFEERVHDKLVLTNQVARKAAIFERLNSH